MVTKEFKGLVHGDYGKTPAPIKKEFSDFILKGEHVKEDDEDFMNAVDYMFAGLEKRKPDCFAVKQYKKYKLASGDICSK